MRGLVICGAVFLGLSGSAIAGGDILRGSQEYEIGAPLYPRWDGIYVGAHGGYGTGGTDFAGATSSLVAFLLRNTDVEEQFQVSRWTTLSKGDTNAIVWGGFAGYNFQWENVVIGVEANYNSTSMSMSSSDSMARAITTSVGGTNYNHVVSVTGTAAVKVTDYGSLRARFGWATQWFLPYATVGLGIVRADVVQSATVRDNWCDATLNPGCTPGTGNAPVTSSNNKLGTFGYGLTGGLGVDVALFENVFVRGEYELFYVPNFNDLNLRINTFRGAVGVRF